MFLGYLLVWIIVLIPGILVIWAFIYLVKNYDGSTSIDKYYK